MQERKWGELMADARKLTVNDIRSRKNSAEKLVVITAYDYTFARLIDDLVDIVLVGDSLGMVVQGNPNTLAVTMDDMVYHAKAVSHALRHAHLVVDMPFMSYQVGIEDAVRNAGRLLQEGRGESVKLEGGLAVAPIVSRLVELGIPVMGHVGLTPQSIHSMGGYKIQGKTQSARDAILADAVALENAGAYAIVLEGIPLPLAQAITDRVKIPTIGIGAGPHCDGQVLVNQDLLGLNPEFSPKFVKRFASLDSAVREAVKQYATEVQNGLFPEEKHSFL